MKYPLTGKSLTNLAKLWGIKRRWFGLESDDRLRSRLVAAINKVVAS